MKAYLAHLTSNRRQNTPESSHEGKRTESQAEAVPAPSYSCIPPTADSTQ